MSINVVSQGAIIQILRVLSLTQIKDGGSGVPKQGSDEYEIALIYYFLILNYTLIVIQSVN